MLVAFPRQGARDYSITQSYVLNGSHDVSAGCLVKRIPIEIRLPAPDRPQGFLRRLAASGSGLKEERQIEVLVSRFTFPRWNVMNIDPNQHGLCRRNEVDSSLLHGLSLRRVPRIDVGGFHMSTRLEPAAETPMKNEQELI
jgi:hypothetical protein